MPKQVSQLTICDDAQLLGRGLQVKLLSSLSSQYSSSWQNQAPHGKPGPLPHELSYIPTATPAALAAHSLA